jgi:antitoxin-like ribbon-helix-helix protein
MAKVSNMKRPTLKSARQSAARGRTTTAATPETPHKPGRFRPELHPDEPQQQPQAKPKPKTEAERNPARVGKRQVAAFFAPEVGRALKLLAAERDSTVQALMAEALNDLFRKHRKPPIA